MTYAIITMHDEHYKKLADITMLNKTQYCEERGYKLFAKTDNFSPKPKAIYFDKLRYILEILNNNSDIKWAWWLDCDALITNFNISIEQWCDNDYHIAISLDKNTINNGSFFIRNSEEGKRFIKRSLILEADDQYVNETGTMEDLYKTTAYKDIIKLHSQRDFNSNNYEFYMSHYKHYQYFDDLDRFGNSGQWQLGDFVCHWPGMLMEHKIELALLILQDIVSRKIDNNN